MPKNSPAILLVEDDQVDVMSFRRAAKNAGLSVPLIVASDGTEALRILSQASNQGHTHYIVITDLSMPGLSGHQLIEAVRDDKALQRSIIFVLTSSDLASDKSRAYDKNVAGYFVKSANGNNLTSLVAMLDAYCTSVTQPPKQID